MNNNNNVRNPYHSGRNTNAYQSNSHSHSHSNSSRMMPIGDASLLDMMDAMPPPTISPPPIALPVAVAAEPIGLSSSIQLNPPSSHPQDTTTAHAVNNDNNVNPSSNNASTPPPPAAASTSSSLSPSSLLMVQSLQAQVEALQETNFDLEATLATMQAEQQYSMQQLQDRLKDETAKLQHALRLEQQTTQRLLQQQQQHQHRHASSSSSTAAAATKRARILAAGNHRGDNATLDSFRKRLPTNVVVAATTNMDVDDDDDHDHDDHENQDPEENATAAAIDLGDNGDGTAAAAAATSSLPTEIITTPRGRPSTTTTTATSTGRTATTVQTTTLLPPATTTMTTTTTTHGGGSNGNSNSSSSSTGAAWLARQLLYHCGGGSSFSAAPSSSSSSLDIRNVLIPIATSSTTTIQWTEAQLVEYLLLQQQQQQQQQLQHHNNNMVSYWTEALTWSRSARRGIWEAMQSLERQEEQEQGAETTTTTAAAATTITHPNQSRNPRKPPRIHRLNPDGSRGEPLEDSQDFSSFRRRQLWYTPPVGTSYSSAPAAAAAASTFMNPEAIQDWVGNRLETDNPQHLQLLALILEEEQGNGLGTPPPHSTHIWWSILLPGITGQLIGLHAQYSTTTNNNQTSTPTTRTNSHSKPSGSGRHQMGQQQQQQQEQANIRRKSGTVGGMGTTSNGTNAALTRNAITRSSSHPTAWKDLGWGGNSPARRLRFQSPTPRTALTTTTTISTDNDDDDKGISLEDHQEELLLACLTLMERLIVVTKLDVLEAWYALPPGGGPPKQPYLMEDDLSEAAEESALLWIGLLLDIVEGLDFQFYYHRDQNSQQQQQQQGRRRRLALPKWYLQLVSLFATIGQTKGGMKALRTRLPDFAGGEVMPNVLDTATMQLFQLSTLEEEEDDDDDEKQESNRTPVGQDQEQRRFVMDYWIRLWHQALLFVQGQTSSSSSTPGSKTTTTMISFRSLLLDLQDYYTSAYTRILADPSVKPEIHSMIRLQLEELALDEEEHDDWKETS